MTEPTRYFVVVRERGDKWDPSLPMPEQELWEAHAEFMNGLVDDGFVVLGGPVGDGHPHRALLIVDAATETEVRERLAADPWSPQLLTIASIEPWTILLGPDAPRG